MSEYSPKLGRRDFIRLAGAAAIGVGLQSCGTSLPLEETPTPSTPEAQKNIVVIDPNSSFDFQHYEIQNRTTNLQQHHDDQTFIDVTNRNRIFLSDESPNSLTEETLNNLPIAKFSRFFVEESGRKVIQINGSEVIRGSQELGIDTESRDYLHVLSYFTSLAIFAGFSKWKANDYLEYKRFVTSFTTDAVNGKEVLFAIIRPTENNIATPVPPVIPKPEILAFCENCLLSDF